MTYCRCSEGFIKSYWEEILGRPVKVEILESVISGGRECRFAVRLREPQDPP
jgi:predicted hydrocarbon binding protein